MGTHLRATAVAAMLVAAALGGCGDDATSSGMDADTTRDARPSGDLGHDGAAVAVDAREPDDDSAVEPDSAIPEMDSATPDSGAPDSGPPPPLGDRWVTGYYVGYQRDLYPPEVVDLADLTHLVVGRITPNVDGSVDTTFDIDEVAGPALARDLSARAHAAGKKALLMVGGAGEEAGWNGATSAEHRADFVASLVATMRELGYDGLDLDWEPIDPARAPDLIALVSELRAAAPGVILTIPVLWVNANFPEVASFYVELASMVDQMNVMTYDMAGPWDGWDSWFSSAVRGASPTTPSSVETNVDAFLAAGIPAARLGIGIGFYGTCWTGVTGPRMSLAGATFVASDNQMSFASIMADYHSDSAYRYDEAAESPYLTFDGGGGPLRCNFVSYENERSIAAKGALARSRGLGGAIIWTINQGYLPSAPAGERDPVLRATADAFLR